MTQSEIADFVKTVGDAYTYEELSVIPLSLDRNFLDYVSPNMSPRVQVMKLVEAANRQGWISELVLGVVADQPNNQSVRKFLSKYPHWDPANH